jgi:hypothetical protein
MPFLGKAQFEIIAEASEEFDRYLKHTLGDVDADLARKEGIRSDYYGIQTVGKVPSVSRTALRTGRRNGRDLESDLEVPSEGSEDDDDDEEDEEDENSKQIKATPSSSSKSATTGGTKEESGENDTDYGSSIQEVFAVPEDGKEVTENILQTRKRRLVIFVFSPEWNNTKGNSTLYCFICLVP